MWACGETTAPMDVLYIIVGLAAGFFAAWLIGSRRSAAAGNTAAAELKEALCRQAETEKQLSAAEKAATLHREEVLGLRREAAVLQEQIHLQQEQILLSTRENAILQADNRNLQEALEQRKTEMADLQKRLTSEFELIAGRILKERSAELVGVNQKQLGDLLNPLKEKIQSFEKKVDETYDKELRDRVSLREEVRKLTELNVRVSEDANNLARALKGDVKKQGNWGEMVLERVLEMSGLTRDVEYSVQEELRGNDGERLRPDVIINLPDEKHIVIDAKVSLVAYQRMSSSEDETERAFFLEEHIKSLRRHVKELGEKNYQSAGHLNTPDFVLMFLPIEASFAVAVQAGDDLYSYAWDRKIVIVSPTTLLATLRTVASIWKQENQTKNAQHIAKLSGALYNKFVGFVEDMQKVKLGIERAAKSYDDAYSKLCTGKGNMVRTAERIRDMGARVGNKSLPTDFDQE